MTEEEMINGCRSNSQIHQKMLYEKYFSNLFQYAKGLIKDRNDAFDITQETFIKAFSNIHKFSGTGEFIGWMKRMLKNDFIYYKRNKKFASFYFFSMIRYENNEIFKFIDVRNSKNDILDCEYEEIKPYDNFTKIDVLNALNNVSKCMRLSFEMFVLQGMSHEEIAKKLGITESTSKTNLLKARKKIKKILEEQKK